MAVDEGPQLRNEERAFFLALERALAGLHKDLLAIRRTVERVEDETMLKALDGSLWSVGNACLEASSRVSTLSA